MSDTSILDRLAKCLDEHSPKLASFLYRIWGNMEHAITYRELREAILDGSLSIEYLEQWREDYSVFIEKYYLPLIIAVVEQARIDLLAEYGGFLRDPAIPAMEDFIRRQGGRLIREVSESQTNAINILVRRATMSDTMTVDELARAIRPCIGLTEKQAASTYKVYEHMREQGKGHKEALRRQATYAAKLHRRRAAMIAQTEMAYAYNAGADAVIRQNIADGYMKPDMKKEWLTAADERVCGQCGKIEGEIVALDAEFSIGVKLPPAHPNCRCAVAYRMEEYERDKTDNPFAWLKDATQEQKEKLLGGKSKRALYDAGILDKEDYFTPLNELQKRGIIVPDKAALDHSCIGEYIKASNDFPNGRLKSGGHARISMDEMNSRGIDYHIDRTCNNGVMFGNVPTHKERVKRTGEGQAWFPQSWTLEDIRTAGTYVANKGAIIANQNTIIQEGIWNDVNVRVIMSEGRIGTICPSYDQ